MAAARAADVPEAVQDLKAPQAPRTVTGKGSVGLEWEPVAGASGYRVYWSTEAGFTPATALGVIEDAQPGIVHRGLEDGRAYHYRVSALGPADESPPSPATQAVPEGEFVLERLGTGAVPDYGGDELLSLPIDRRLHIVLAAEGYTANDLPRFEEDVEQWLGEVFRIEPYRELREAFVVWSLPRASRTHLEGGDTAFGLSASGSGSIRTPNAGTAQRLWESLDDFPHPLRFGPMAGERDTTALNLVTSFLVFDPRWGQAGHSGLATGLADASGKRRVQVAIARGHAHELGHALARLKDEYLDFRIKRTSQEETSNVAASSRCSSLPWRHLLPGSHLNADDDGLIGAFGRPTLGFHPELKCLMNGAHDNAAFYGGDGRLRAHERLCNWCRELTTFRIYERLGHVVSFATWKSRYREPYYEKIGLVRPRSVPQRTSDGKAHFEPCAP